VALTMRRWVTWLVVAGLAALGLAAAVDALRGDEQVRRSDARPPAIPGLDEQPELAIRQLREAGVRGVLTYADEECRLHAVSLPELRAVRAPTFEMCRPATPSGGLGAVDGDVVWAGLGFGAFQVVLSEEELGPQVSRWLSGGQPDEGEGFRAVQAVALGEQRAAVLADSTYEPRERVLVLLEGDRVVLVQPRWVIRDARLLRPSPNGAYFAAFTPEGLLWFDRDADPRAFPTAVRSPRAVTWSPDDSWMALATADSVYVFRSDQPNERIIRIPLSVRDLDWSASALDARTP
jgi:hypothetical protein